jgi:hypothetical protein
MYCPSCGEEVADDSTFCRYCGTDLDLNPESDLEPAVRPTTSEPEQQAANDAGGWVNTIGKLLAYLVGGCHRTVTTPKSRVNAEVVWTQRPCKMILR